MTATDLRPLEAKVVGKVVMVGTEEGHPSRVIGEKFIICWLEVRPAFRWAQRSLRRLK